MITTRIKAMKNLTKHFVIVFVSLFPFLVMSQYNDIIVFKEGDSINCVINKITENQIIYSTDSNGQSRLEQDNISKVQSCNRYGMWLEEAEWTEKTEDESILIDSEKSHIGWANLGMGLSSIGFSYGISGSLLIKHHFISTRFIGNEHVGVSYNIFNGEWSLFSEKQTYDFGLLYGWGNRWKWGLFTISGGISRVSIETDLTIESDFEQRREHKSNTTIGFPLETQLFVHGENFGCGFYYFVNINSEEIYYGALFCLQIGILR